MRIRLALVGLLAPLAAAASPGVSPEDPRYDELARRRAAGELPPYQGGLMPLTEARVRRLLGDPALPRGAWVRIDRALVGVARDDDRLRPYDTDVRPRDLAGGVAITCEHAQGRPCIGRGALAEVDGSAGYGDRVSATLRLRANAGSGGYAADDGADLPALAIDRAYLHAAYGPLALHVGRDIVVVGPRSRTQLGWGDHAPPVDALRLSTTEPVRLSRRARGSLNYTVGRLRDPQRFPGTLFTLARGQLDLADRVELGVMQLLQLGGEGAYELGPWQFLTEHVLRNDLSAGETDSSNRRFGGDIAWTVPELRGARLYYQLVFEDIRARRFVDALRHDADHLLGVELAALGRHGVVVEYQTTGMRSQEHSPRVTGFTNRGRVVGSPLGPEGRSIYAGARVALPRATLHPWLERTSNGTDVYQSIVYGPIDRVSRGIQERRYRAGALVRVPVRAGLSIEAELAIERVSNAGFVREASATHTRLALQLAWRAPS